MVLPFLVAAAAGGAVCNAAAWPARDASSRWRCAAGLSKFRAALATRDAVACALFAAPAWAGLAEAAVTVAILRAAGLLRPADAVRFAAFAAGFAAGELDFDFDGLDGRVEGCRGVADADVAGFAVLASADLAGADLAGAILAGAILARAILPNTVLASAVLDVRFADVAAKGAAGLLRDLPTRDFAPIRAPGVAGFAGLRR